MENTTTPATTTSSPPPVDISPLILLHALYWVWDAFDRVNMPMFLVYQTAKDAIKQRDLTGNKVEVGVRRMEWESGGRRILDAFIQPIKEEKTLIEYRYNNEVPVIVHVFEDHDCIVQTDMVRYRHEEFKIPNPYSKFEEVFSG